ncbi:uncharacterized protein K02A2.6-like [Culex pipiens pallens]|uniref:uncharacterized protein K02A2.6-like n=1 Tax=Culex pipiens pallens TaxID=42434 RepID=UPI0019546D63|nr:uncharacterized protein K02A2.6-like [Culex pipiens pallens]
MDLLVSDNGPQFTSSEFRTFLKQNGIQHVTTAPYHPASNGQAERFVDTLKRALKKINEGEDLEETLQPPKLTPANEMQNADYDRKHGAVERCFAPGDLIFAHVFRRNDFTWAPGQVIEKVGAVNYVIKLEGSNRPIKVHTNQIRRRRVANATSAEAQPGTLPLDILLDNFVGSH